VNGLPLQETRKERQSTEMRGCRRLAHQHCASGTIDVAWARPVDLGVQLAEGYGVIFGAREEFIFGGKYEGFLRWPQNW
jgi:hypothetical protein